MSSHLEALRARKDAPVSLAHKIALHTTQSLNNVVIVESGDDFYFYSSIALRTDPDNNIQFFSAGRRKIVLDTIDALNKLGKSDRCYGIVDRDFHFEDPEMINNQILVIDVYSFENYFSYKKDLLNIGKSFFSLEPGAHLDDWESRVEAFLATLAEAWKPEHILAIACLKNNVSCTLSNLHYSHIVDVHPSGEVSRRDNARDIFIEKCDIDRDFVIDIDLSIYENDLKDKNWRSFIRGHVFWDCLVKKINLFRDDLDKKFKETGASRARTRQELNSSHVLEAATAIITPPTRIVEFFREVAARGN